LEGKKIVRGLINSYAQRCALVLQGSAGPFSRSAGTSNKWRWQLDGLDSKRWVDFQMMCVCLREPIGWHGRSAR